MKKGTLILLLILVIALGALFRLWDLHQTPPALYPDEAMNANDAVETLETGSFRVFYDDNNGREGFFVWLIAASFSLFGVSTFSLRLVSAIGGIVLLPGVYLLVRSLLRNQWVALLSTFFTAISFWHVNFSRIGFRAVWMVTLLVWGIWFLWEGINREMQDERKAPWLHMIGAGALIGLSAYTYVGVRVFPLALLLITLLLLYRAQWKKRTWLLLGTAALTALLVVSPLALFFIQHPEQISARSGDVSVFGAEEPVRELAISTIKTAGMFHVLGDCNWRHNYARPAPLSGRACAPQLLWPVGIFALVGFLFSLGIILRGGRHRSAHLALLVWFLVMLLPAALTREGIPHALRSIGVIPIPLIYAALGAVWILRKLKKPRSWWIAALVVVLIGIGTQQWFKYFTLWGQAPETHWAFEEPLVDAAEALLTAPPDAQRIVVVNRNGVLVDDVPMPAQTIKFIMNKETSRNAASIQRDMETVYVTPDAFESLTLTPNTAILFLRPDSDQHNRILQEFSTASLEMDEDFSLMLIR